MSRSLLAVLVVLSFSAWAAPAQAEDQTASSGAVTATFSFDDAEVFGGELWLTISRNGEVLYDGAPEVGDCDFYDSCGPGGGEQRDSVRVRDLDGDGEPEVILDLFWGGAHCCFFANVYSFDGAGYSSRSRDFGDFGYRIGDIDDDGVPEFVSGDARFAYRFTSFASSVFPIEIMAFSDGAFHDSTAQHPDRVRADARRAWRIFREVSGSNEYEPRGAIAAWAADRYRLGMRAATLKQLRALAHRGRLPGTPPRSQSRFVVALDRFLRRAGYARSG